MLGIIDTALGQSATDVLNQLMASVDGFVGLVRQHDDITCLVLRTFN
jgi:serine phosphatase RsbU (regulator of sigma subunit)